jgi:hypothetical protein
MCVINSWRAGGGVSEKLRFVAVPNYCGVNILTLGDFNMRLLAYSELAPAQYSRCPGIRARKE